jgi:FkbM family methyltransferase
MDLISSALHYIGKNNPNAFVLQIGAMDGIDFDDTRGFLDMYKWPALLVEPIPSLFNELKENFKDRSNYIFEQSAISNTDGEVIMLTIPSEIIEQEKLEPGYRGMSGIYPLKNGFGSTYQRDIDVKRDFGVDIKVPSLTLESLLKKHNIDHFDILICDTEGYDWNIFNQLDINKFRPDFIRLEYINLTEEEKELTVQKFKDNGYTIEIGQDIDGVSNSLWEKINKESPQTLQPKITYEDVRIMTKSLDEGDKTRLLRYLNGKEINVTNNDITVVTGLWNIGRPGRDFSHYIEHFKKFLEIPVNMFIYIPQEYEYLIWEKRSKENTFVKICELNYLKNLYEPFWNQTQSIRNNPKWFNSTGEGGWLKNSPQATLEWYNPIVQSKMFLLNDATIWNPFNCEYFIWLDAGITNTVYDQSLIDERALDNIIPYLNSFLFLSYPYESAGEIHGFNFERMNRYAGDTVKYVCRGGLFGGKKDVIHQANGTYYSTLMSSLNEGYMGTEESIFSIMSYREPHIYRRYALDGNGLIGKFIQDLISKNAVLEPIPESKPSALITVSDYDLLKLKTNLYILTFNFPEQLQNTISSMEKVPEWLSIPHLVLLDNSTDENAIAGNKIIAEKYNFEYIKMSHNTGICGGRQFAAEHFGASNADFMFFFEDDMTVNSPELEGQYCRNGFRKYIPNLYTILHKIMLKENFDFLKMSFTEVYFDNDKALPWYNVPQHIRTRDWPKYDKLPITGLDPNSPSTKYSHIKILDGVAYATGEVNYCNWPMIVSKEGNQKMFIDTKWAHPFEQTWSSHMYQLIKEGKLSPGLLLASPIWHERIIYYKPEERREN